MKRFAPFLLALLLAPATLAPAQAPEPAPAAPPAPASPHDVNYAFGLLIGQSLASTGMTFDLDAVRQGLEDSLDKTRKPLFDADKAKQIVNEAMQALQEKVTAAQREKEQGYLDGHAKVKGVVTTTSGLQYEVLKEGTGPKPKATDTVKVDYVGTLVDGTEFDSSVKRGEPAVFTLDQVIPAWTEGLQLMAVGGKYRFTVPSKLAYGAQGAGGVIPPFATLVFEVDLLSIEAPPAPEAAAPAETPAPAEAPPASPAK